MDLEIIILNEVKSDTEKQIPYITYPWNIKKKKGTKELIYKIEIELQV